MMSLVKKRFFLFIFACIPIRLLAAYLVKQTPFKYIKYLGFLFALIGGAFLLSYINYNPQKDMGAFGGIIWWNNMRAFHGCMYILYSILSIHYNKNVWEILAIDPIFGLLAYFIFKQTTS